MSMVMRTICVRHAVFGLALTGLAISSIATANAGDFEAPAYNSYSYGAEAEGICRIFHERRVDPYGRETVHRIRMCDEGPIYPSLNGTAAPPEYGYRSRRYYEPSPSRYESYPRPPVAYPSVSATAAPPQYGYRPRQYYNPSPSSNDSYIPRPPAAIDQNYYNRAYETRGE
jgi:hypothetical protein